MKFLIDEQLPPALARFLEEMGEEAAHVADICLNGATDREIWLEAKERGAAIVTKDEDFVALRSTEQDGPSVVWLRMGNTRTGPLLDRMRQVLPVLIAQLEKNEVLVEVL